MTSTGFAASATKTGKARLGSTAPEATPIAIRSRIDLPRDFADRVRTDLGRKLGHAATLTERGTVRFEDVNGPKGGIDIVCRITLMISGRPSVHVAQTAANPQAAFANAASALVQVLERARGKHDLHVRRRRAAEPTVAKPVVASLDAGEIIGRRVGRGAAARARALERPEKQRRDA